MSIPKFAIRTTDVALSPSPINPSFIREGNPQARSRMLDRSTDGLACTIVWECNAGKFEWVYDIDETVYILEGNVTISDASSPPRLLGPGDVIFFPNGSRAHWHIEDRVRKIAFCQKTLPKFAHLPIAMLRKLKALLSGSTAPGLMDAGPESA